MILGIDVGLSMGWAAMYSGGLQGYGTLKLPTGATYRARIERIQQLIDAWKPDAVVVEDVAFSRYPMAHASYWRLRTLLAIVCEDAGVPLDVVPVTTLKKFATGKGNAKKDAMVAAVNDRFGLKLSPTKKADTDTADAVMAAAWWLDDRR